MPTNLSTAIAAIFLASILWVGPAIGQVAGFEIVKREQVAGGRVFGAAGTYERIDGKISFALDPHNRFNARIVDLDRAPRNDDGKVIATANLIVLQATDPDRRSGTALLEVSNRGGRAALRYFNLAIDTDYGDGFLLNRGVTIIWVGWQFDIIPDPARMSIEVPIARGPNGEMITGLVRADWPVDVATNELYLAHRENHRPYAVHDPDSGKHRLTYRETREGERTQVPRADWRFSDDGTKIVMAQGFTPGRIYELVYEGREPAVVGLGLAAIRDTLAYAKYDKDAPFPVARGIALGISQTGRFLRQFLYQGFNTDSEGRKVFDGMMIMTAGAGRGSFNHRFAQPSRDGHRYSAFFYPTDLFPFSSRLQEDPLTGWFDGLFAHQHDTNHVPRVFYVNTGYEYWGRSAALIHTTVDGKTDFPPTNRERIYHLASTQHYRGDLENNPIDLYLVYRPLMANLLDWVQLGEPPPRSNYPRRADGTLVNIDAIRDPGIPGVKWPEVTQLAYRADYGPQWAQGIITRQPPELGPAFPSLVPQVNEFGNEISGLKTLEIRVPLGTYLPWKLRTGFAGGNGELVDFIGGFHPFPTTDAARRQAGDPRPSIQQLYGDRSQFEMQLREAAAVMVTERVLLPEDVERAVLRCLATWDHVHETP